MKLPIKITLPASTEINSIHVVAMLQFGEVNSHKSDLQLATVL